MSFSSFSSFRKERNEKILLQAIMEKSTENPNISMAGSRVYPIEKIVTDAIQRNAKILHCLKLNRKYVFASEPSSSLASSATATEDQIKAYNLLKEGHPIVAILGPGGTGKSQFIEWIQDRYRESGRHVSVTATTGYAAYQIKGVTYFRFLNLKTDWYRYATGFASGVKPEELDLHQFLKLVAMYHRNIQVCHRIIETDLLIIDEISMIDGPTLLVMDMICRYIRQEPNKLFGGIQCLWSGDFLQLPPVSPVTYSPAATTARTEFVFQYFAWKDIWKPKVQLFTQNVRSIDPRWSELLGRMRVGKCNEEDIELLKTRTSKAIARSRTAAGLPPGAVLTHVFPFTRKVQEFNEKERIKLKDRDHRFFQHIRLALGNDQIIGLDHPIYVEYVQKMNTAVSSSSSSSSPVLSPHDKYPMALCSEDEFTEPALDRFLEDLRYEQSVTFRVGEKIMLRENLFQHQGLVNGSTGKIIGYTNFHTVHEDFFTQSYQYKKRTKGGEDISFVSVTPDQYDNSSNGYPVVQWSNGLITFVPYSIRKLVLATITENKLPASESAASEEPVKDKKKEKSTVKERKSVELSIFTFVMPIQSAAAITSHKCQGLTLPFVFVGNPDKCFEKGMFYVMCSRVRSLDHLFLDDQFEASHIQAQADAVEFFESFKD